MIERIKDYIFYYISDIESEEDLIKTIEMFKEFINKFSQLHENFDRNKAYTELEEFLKMLKVGEIIQEVKRLDTEQLKDLLLSLKEELEKIKNNMEADIGAWENDD